MQRPMVISSLALVTVCLSCGWSSEYEQAVAKDAPVAWLRFQDATSNDGATAKDGTGAQAGMYKGNVTLEAGPGGIGGKAAKFDGTSTCVEIPHHADFALNTLSVECWFRSMQPWTEPNWPASATLISKGTGGGGSSDWVLLGGSGDGKQGCVMARAGPQGGEDVQVLSPAKLNDGQWHHVVWTRNADGRNRFYIDGTLVATRQDSGGAIVNDRPIQIGGDPFLKGKFFDGWIAEVAIYKTVLDEARVVAHLRAAGMEPRKFSANVTTKEASAMAETTRRDSAGGWVKYEKNPVLGGQYGTCFDIAVLRENDAYRMWVSWRPKKSIALVESKDGLSWSAPEIVLPPAPTFWEEDLNRPTVLKRADGYHMWYTGQAKGKNSWIGYATSPDGKTWKRMSDKPVLSFEQPWEKVAVMCPHVLWDEKAKLFRMWYSGGEQYEPNAIGYATSPDGLNWTKHEKNPVFTPDPAIPWEKERVAGAQVEKRGDWYVIFYIGYRDIDHAQIGIARSKDGISNWQRHPENPIVRSGTGQWDDDACYKPYAIFDGTKWLLWYNGRRKSLEQIGVVIHQGEDLGFDAAAKGSAGVVLKTDEFKHYVDEFNRNDNELYAQYVPNAAAWDFLKGNIPLLDCPDQELEETYYFRWWTYRKHLKETPDGFVITEFLPKVSWAGKHNTINCAAGHHIYEGRWLSDPKYLDDYVAFWLRKGGAVRSYSFWIADAMWKRFCATGDDRQIKEFLPDLIRNYGGWEKDRRDPNGLFWQVDDRDGMEASISGRLGAKGQGYRATINSYLYGDALAIAAMAERVGQTDVAKTYREKAAQIKQFVEVKLWDKEAQFFKVLPRGKDTLSDAREEHGFTPWYMNLPGADKAVAWKQLMDPKGFYAPFGPTTAEQRHPGFALSYQGHECQWNGPSWPFSTAVTLTAMANLLNGYEQDAVTRKDYFEILKIYTKSHHLKLDDGRVVPWIDENLNPQTGDWISRTRLKSWKNGTWDAGKGGVERGKDYNHSTYCDLVITGLIGLRPRADDTVEVNPLVPESTWDWFCLDKVSYHGRMLTILYDRTGAKYGRGQGLRVLADGKEIAVSEKLGRVTGRLTAANPGQ